MIGTTPLYTITLPKHNAFLVPDDERAEIERDYCIAPQSAPSPADRVVAEVMALPASVIPSTIETPGDYLGEIGMIGVRIRGMLSTRDMLVRIARVAIAGVLACDAKGGA